MSSLYHRKNEIVTVKKVTNGGNLVYMKYRRTGKGLVPVRERRIDHNKKRYVAKGARKHYHSAPTRRGGDLASSVRQSVEDAQLGMLDKQIAEKHHRDNYNAAMSSRLNQLSGGRSGGVNRDVAGRVARALSGKGLSYI